MQKLIVRTKDRPKATPKPRFPMHVNERPIKLTQNVNSTCVYHQTHLACLIAALYCYLQWKCASGNLNNASLSCLYMARLNKCRQETKQSKSLTSRAKE